MGALLVWGFLTLQIRNSVAKLNEWAQFIHEGEPSLSACPAFPHRPA